MEQEREEKNTDLNHYYQSTDRAAFRAGSANNCFWEVTNFGLICIIPLISLAFSSEDGELKKIYVLSLYIFLDDLYLESQGCQQLQSVDINYQSFTSCDFPSLAG